MRSAGTPDGQPSLPSTDDVSLQNDDKTRQEYVEFWHIFVIGCGGADHLSDRKGMGNMEPKIERHPAYRIVGMKYRGRNQQGEIPALWGQFAARVAEVQDRAEQDVTYGVSANYAEDTGAFDYVAGIHVNPTAAVPPDMVSMDIPPQTYAVFACTLPTIDETMRHIHHTWLPASGYRRSVGPELERYDEAFNPQDPASIMYILVPITEA